MRPSRPMPLATSWTSAPTFSQSSARKRSEEHTSELQSQSNLVCRLLLEKKNHLAVISLLLLGAADAGCAQRPASTVPQGPAPSAPATSVPSAAPVPYHSSPSTPAAPARG